MYLPILLPPPEQERPVNTSSSSNIYRHDAPWLVDKVGTTRAWPLTTKQALTAAWWRSVTKDHHPEDHLLATMEPLWSSRTARGSFKRYRRRYVLAPAQRARDTPEEETLPEQVAPEELEQPEPLSEALQRRQGKGKDDGKGKGKHARRSSHFPGGTRIRSMQCGPRDSKLGLR